MTKNIEKISYLNKKYFFIKNLISYSLLIVFRIFKPVLRNQKYVRKAQNFHRKIEFKIFKNLEFNQYTMYDNFEKNKILLNHDLIIGNNFLIRKKVYKILDKFIKKRKKNELILELGSGNGRNLAYFAKKYKNLKYIGIDISDTNYLTSIYFKNKFKINNLKFFKKDITLEKTFKNLKINPDLIFTCFAIEQIPYRFENVLENIAKLQPELLIFIEPFPEYQGLTLRGISTKLRAKSFSRIYRHKKLINDFKKKYNYKLLEEGKCGFGGNPFNEACKVILKKSN
ncbi:class I SAM-dependent methyltransferase [Candidatus Pelagibacter bacterium nBUS_44]|uniref:class I SAM-dependent methyltransferase n=1 Tax=Candidatus Pelagibacter bacterium nBUS_44 TaxID=3374195 RepID=UPI003EB9BCCA